MKRKSVRIFWQIKSVSAVQMCKEDVGGRFITHKVDTCPIDKGTHTQAKLEKEFCFLKSLNPAANFGDCLQCWQSA